MKPCRRCLLDGQTEAELLAQIQLRLETMPEEQRVSDALYQQRLARCTACDQLNSGTCAQCGCFVQLRAAKRAMSCPLPVPSWTKADKPIEP